MKYKVVKKRIGAKGISVLSQFETEREIIDSSFVDSKGIIFIEKGNSALSFVTLEGKVTREWIGKSNDARIQNGSQDIARFKSPCSVCNSDVFAYVIEEEGRVIRRFGLEGLYLESFSGKFYQKELKKQLSKECIDPVIKSTAGKNQVFFTNNLLNKCFCVNHGRLGRVIGDCKKRFAVSSDYTRASFNRPSGVFSVGNSIYIADTNNHCIRKIDSKNKAVNIVAGTPMDTKHILKKPSKLVVKRSMVFVLDGDTIKVTGLNSDSISTVYTSSDHIDSFEADTHRNIYMLERENE